MNEVEERRKAERKKTRKIEDEGHWITCTTVRVDNEGDDEEEEQQVTIDWILEWSGKLGAPIVI